jgi:hypothetical protein
MGMRTIALTLFAAAGVAYAEPAPAQANVLFDESGPALHSTEKRSQYLRLGEKPSSYVFHQWFGKTLEPKDLANKVVVVVIDAGIGPEATRGAYFQGIQSLLTTFPTGLVVYGLDNVARSSASDDAEMKTAIEQTIVQERAFFAKYKVTFPVAYGNDVVAALKAVEYDGSLVPRIYVLGTDGRVAASVLGKQLEKVDLVRTKLATILQPATAGDVKPAGKGFAADFNGNKHVFKYGRTVTTMKDGHWIVLTEKPFPCKETKLPAGYSVIVFLGNDPKETAVRVGLNDKDLSRVTHATIDLKVDLDHDRALGTLEIAPDQGYSGRGTFDVAVCRNKIEP